MTLKLSLTNENEDCAILEAHGAIQGLVDYDEFVTKSILGAGFKYLLLDCKDVTYINSSGFGTLVRHAEQFKELGGGMALVNIRTKVRIVVDLLGLTSFFTLADSVEQAYEKLGIEVAKTEPSKVEHSEPLDKVRFEADPYKYVELEALSPPPHPGRTALSVKFAVHDMKGSLVSVQTQLTDIEQFARDLHKITSSGLGRACLQGKNEGELKFICPGEFRLIIEGLQGSPRALVSVELIKNYEGGADIPFQGRSQGRFTLNHSRLADLARQVEGLLGHVRV